MPAGAVVGVWNQLVEIGSPHNNGEEANRPVGPERFRMRPAGWHAFNIARIEAGEPLFYVDFGPTNLPHETGVLYDRIRFDKGCYLGQEVVARMESLGKPKQVLRCLKVGEVLTEDSQQPITGDLIYPADDRDADAIGAVTSSTLSPMLGQTAICFAQVKSKNADPGASLDIEVSGARIRAVVQDSLQVWRKPEER